MLFRSILCTVTFLLMTVAAVSQTQVADGPLGKMGPYTKPPAFYPEPYDPPPMQPIPAGEYKMGDHHDGLPDALPVHAVYIDAFFMDVFEVTNEEYCKYLNSAMNQNPPLIEVQYGVVYKKNDSEPYCSTTISSSHSRITWNGSTFGVTAGKEDHPMLEVSWYGAAAYANWRSAQELLIPCYDLETWECTFGAGGYRLPTEAEWEKAARGGEHNPYYRYPWGDNVDGSTANYAGSGDLYESGPYPWTTPVGYYDGNQSPPGGDMANGYGLYDMAGNVWEWCNDWYSSSYYQYCVDNGIYYNPTGPTGGNHRVIRGGSWFLGPTFMRCAYRSYYIPEDRHHNLGFRLVRD